MPAARSLSSARTAPSPLITPNAASAEIGATQRRIGLGMVFLLLAGLQAWEVTHTRPLYFLEGWPLPVLPVSMSTLNTWSARPSLCHSSQKR